MDKHGLCASQSGHVRIGNPVRGRNDHLVAGIQQSQAQIEQCLLGTRGNNDLRDSVVEPVIALELALNRFLEFARTVNGRVFRVPGVDRFDCRVLDGLGSIEVGLACAEADDVAAGSA